MPTRQDDMLQSFSSKPISESLGEKFTNSIFDEYPKLKYLRPISYSNAFDKLKSNTSAGLPHLTSKSNWKLRFIKKLNEFYPNQAFDEQCRLFFLESSDKKFYAITFTRTQENEKTRNVWGYPAEKVLLEQRYYIPLLNEQKKKFWRSALSDADNIDFHVTTLMNQANVLGRHLVSVDFKGFDNSVSPNLSTRAFDFIRQLFQSGELYDFELNLISRDFTTLPIFTPFRIFEGSHGVPSGSTFTNEIDSIVQFGVAKSSGVIHELCQVQGDDGLYIVEESGYDTLIKTFEKFGLNLSKDKSDFSKEYCNYLQKLYHPHFRMQNGVIPGVYSTYRALIRLVYPEREPEFGKLKSSGVSLADYNRIRAIQILENCKNHPLHKNLVYFVMDLWSEEGLQVKDAAVINYSNAVRDEDLAYKGNQYGGDLDGWNSFKTVQIINERLRSRI